MRTVSFDVPPQEVGAQDEGSAFIQLMFPDLDPVPGLGHGHGGCRRLLQRGHGGAGPVQRGRLQVTGD